MSIYTNAIQTKVKAVKRGTVLTLIDIPRQFIYGGRLVLHYHVDGLGWVPSAAITGLRRRGVKVGY